MAIWTSICTFLTYLAVGAIAIALICAALEWWIDPFLESEEEDDDE